MSRRNTIQSLKVQVAIGDEIARVDAKFVQTPGA